MEGNKVKLQVRKKARIEIIPLIDEQPPSTRPRAAPILAANRRRTSQTERAAEKRRRKASTDYTDYTDFRTSE